MKVLSSLFLILVLVIAGCSSSQLTSYRTATSDLSLQIKVYHTIGITGQNFKVVINDSTVIDESGNFSGHMESKGKYSGKEVKLLVTYSVGFLGIGSSYNAMVLINNEIKGLFQL